MSPLENIETFVRAMHDRGAEINALQDLVGQLNASMADVVALMEADAKPEDPAKDIAEARMKAEAMAAALGPVLAMLKIPAPSVQVAEPKVAINVQPAAVNLPADKAGQKWRIEIERAGKNPTAPITALIVTRL